MFSNLNKKDWLKNGTYLCVWVFVQGCPFIGKSKSVNLNRNLNNNDWVMKLNVKLCKMHNTNGAIN